VRTRFFCCLMFGIREKTRCAGDVDGTRGAAEPLPILSRA
jgi:hypothetical protein